MSPVVIGVGTRLGRDDEIGLLLVEGLLETGAVADEETRLLEGADAATVASVLLDLDRRAVIVDCADMGNDPGVFRFFDEKAAAFKIHSDTTSTHGLGLAEGIALARHLGFERDVHIFAVQPFDLSPARGLTPEMSALLPALLEALRGELDALG